MAGDFVVASEAEGSRGSSSESPSRETPAVARPIPGSSGVGMRAIEVGQERESESAAREEKSAEDGFHDLGIWMLRAES